MKPQKAASTVPAGFVRMRAPRYVESIAIGRTSYTVEDGHISVHPEDVAILRDRGFQTAADVAAPKPATKPAPMLNKLIGESFPVCNLIDGSGV